MFLNVCKQTFQISHVRILKEVKSALMWNLQHNYFHMKTKILAGFQICISVPLNKSRKCVKLEKYWLYSLHKLPQLHLISWCGNFMEKHSIRIISGDAMQILCIISPETMWKLCLSRKFVYHEIRWNYSILRSDCCTRNRAITK